MVRSHQHILRYPKRTMSTVWPGALRCYIASMHHLLGAVHTCHADCAKAPCTHSGHTLHSHLQGAYSMCPMLLVHQAHGANIGTVHLRHVHGGAACALWQCTKYWPHHANAPCSLIPCTMRTVQTCHTHIVNIHCVLGVVWGQFGDVLAPTPSRFAIEGCIQHF